MRIKKVCKLCIDIGMLVITLLLMASERTGIVLHMFLGAALFILFVAHNILNLAWWAGIGKGLYSRTRWMRTILNVLLLIDFLLVMLSGILYVIIGGTVNVTALVVCVIAALIGARVSALFANKVDAKKQNRVTGVALCGLGAVLALVNWL